MDGLTVSDRGFMHFDPIDGTYENHVRVYESSAMDGAHIWINVGESGLDAAAHLHVDHARLLAERILFLCDNHYQERLDVEPPV